MPQTKVLFYRNRKGVPALDWLRELRRKDTQAYAKCVARIRQLAELGFELRRPTADYLRDGIYELRAKRGRLNFRILYFFHEQNIAVLAHAITKEDKIPQEELRRALERKKLFEENPKLHSYTEDL